MRSHHTQFLEITIFLHLWFLRLNKFKNIRKINIFVPFPRCIWRSVSFHPRCNGFYSSRDPLGINGLPRTNWHPTAMVLFWQSGNYKKNEKNIFLFLTKTFSLGSWFYLFWQNGNTSYFIYIQYMYNAYELLKPVKLKKSSYLNIVILLVTEK